MFPGPNTITALFSKYMCAYNYGPFSFFKKFFLGENSNNNRDSEIRYMAHFPSGSSKKHTLYWA